MKNKQAEILLGVFVTEYERWEDSQTRRKSYAQPNYEKLGYKMFEAYKAAKEYGY